MALIGFLIGWILAFQGAAQLSKFGVASYTADAVGVGLVMELGPLMTAIIVAGRSGASFAAEIGTMKVNEEVDALDTMGLDRIRFLVAPKVLALALMMPLLVVAVMSQLVFSGGMIPVTGRIVLAQLSWITPARWGFASSASTVALSDLVPPPITPADALWDHKFRSWGFDMAMLAGLSIVYLGFVRWKTRLRGG